MDEVRRQPHLLSSRTREIDPADPRRRPPVLVLPLPACQGPTLEPADATLPWIPLATLGFYSLHKHTGTAERLGVVDGRAGSRLPSISWSNKPESLVLHGIAGSVSLLLCSPPPSRSCACTGFDYISYCTY
uniref:Predicted protein n=1 Tax=Hordeum vulgare subsp. vulgare TaxID=112509 RepID=F2E9R0_HORVV|nr:predicted protein [Hordeum vulgare subsp. vulgare]